ncbi:MAG TPA: PEGA domain-containing protein, partial [Candidatus Handelsmanbacteria bacterium]|nr:PEGA domain-containing protein [Candidatus Handelsmanbacteria bacterium]
DGAKAGTVPMEALIPLAPGRHTLKIVKPGYAERTEIVDIRRGQEMEFEIDLLPYAGVFTIESNAPDADLWLDGKPFGALPFKGEIPMGEHTLKIVATGFISADRTLKIEGGQVVDLRFDLKPAPIVAGGDGSILNKWWFWTAAGAVVIGGVTGVVLATGGGTPLPSPNVSLNF